MSKKPSVPKGTRDFSPAEVAKRNYIMQTIKEKFQLFGYQPIETPSFENSETLLGKYGEEGDRLIFKILNSGDFLQKIFNKEEKDFISTLDELINEDLFIACYNSLVTKYNLFKDLTEIENSFLKHEFSKNETELIDEELKRILIEEIERKEVNFKLKNKLLSAIEKTSLITINILLKIRFQSPREYYINKFKSQIISSKISPQISEKALRYDLTVPFARYVVQHQNEITFPFKRYQMQAVWRADRPQKGRFREFWQCDADVVGSKSLWQEVELVQLYDDVFNQLQLKGVTIKINNRKILSGIAEMMGAENKLIDFTVALDKLDKIGEEGVINEMLAKGIEQTAIDKLKPLFSLTGNTEARLSKLRELLAASPTGLEGVDEVAFVVDSVNVLGLKASTIELDVTLARGLDYYTGAIFEVAPPQNVQMGSIGGGGRYDDLTGIFGLKGVSGVGISFGLDRIYLVLEELGLFPTTVEENTKVLFINFGEKEALYAQKAIAHLRDNNIPAELYPDAAKMGKQITYADKRNIPFVALAGETEINKSSYTLKNMKTGEQQEVMLNELDDILN